MSLIAAGVKRRQTGPTNLNSSSSRSHAILMLELEKQSPLAGTKIVTKLNVVDLAGSERLKKSGKKRKMLKKKFYFSQLFFFSTFFFLNIFFFLTQYRCTRSSTKRNTRHQHFINTFKICFDKFGKGRKTHSLQKFEINKSFAWFTWSKINGGKKQLRKKLIQRERKKN